MKRTLILIPILLALLATVALGEGNRLVEVKADYISDLLSDGDALYILGDWQVYVWRPGDAEAAAWSLEPLRYAHGGFPIQRSPDQWIFAPPRSFSQLVTSFIGS